MLSIGKIKATPSSSAKYYTLGDYYTKDGNEPSAWAGKGAEMLGLDGKVDQHTLEHVLAGRLPPGHEAGWEKSGDKHQPGWDMTFNAPKGVSIMALLAGDERLIEAHERAVEKAVKFMEEYAHVRVRGDDNSIIYRHTGNLVSGKFTEFFSRALDAHMHTHVPTANMTYDEERGKWYALDSRAIYKMKMAGGQVYRNELAADVRENIGYEITTNSETGLWDLKDVPEALIDINSSRRKEIVEYAEKHGWESAAEYAFATLNTRPDKKKTDHQKVIEDLKFRSQKYLGDIDKLRDKSYQADKITERDPKEADYAAQHSLRHLGAREAVFEHGHTLLEALKVSLGKATRDDIEAALERRQDKQAYLDTEHHTGGTHIYHGRTVENSVAWETRLAEHVLKQRNVVRPLASAEKVKAVLDKSTLTDEQKKAARSMLRTTDRVISVAGVAGSGKSHLVKDVVNATPSRKFLALAPTATAAVDLGKDAGIPGKTVAGFLQTGGHGIGRNTVLLVDEASMASTRQAARLMDIAEQKKSRIVFIGDTKQFDAIEQGKPLALMMSMGLRGPFMGTSFRQKNMPMQNLVKAAREGKFSEAFRIIGPRLQEVNDKTLAQEDGPKSLAEHVAKKWFEDSNRDKIQIAALDNSSRIALNAHIRGMLKEEGRLGVGESEFQVLSSKGLTSAQLSEADYYKTDDIVVFHMGHKALGAEKDEQFQVLASNDGKVQLESEKTGNRIDFDPRRTRKKGMTLYSRQDRQLSKGDIIQWRKNLSNDKQVQNGHTGVIEQVKGDKATILFDHGIRRKLDLKKNPYWDHGYAITTYKQQGKTTPSNWIVANTTKAGEITQKTLYVSLTRAERSIQIFTDDKDKFKSEVRQNPGGKTSSLQGRGILIDLKEPIKSRRQTGVEKFFDRMHDHIRTPAMNLLDRIDEKRRERDAKQKDSRADDRLQKALKEHEATKGREAQKAHEKTHEKSHDGPER